MTVVLIMHVCKLVVDPEFLKRGAEDNVSAPLAFITNAHIGLYPFYTGKSDLLLKISQANRGGAAALPFFESYTDSILCQHVI